MYKDLTNRDLDEFKKIVGELYVDDTAIENYASDATEQLKFFPDVVLKPSTAKEVSQIVKYCNENSLPITPRGAGTGLSGGALPIKGGVVISLERMNKILSIDEKNFQVKLEAGVINYDLQLALSEINLFYPPDPSSWQSSFIGGNIMTNAGGARAVKYGVTSAYVLNLEMVLPNGEIIWTGANTLKNSTGINLTQLFVGSEGTLGIVTKAILKVLPKPQNEVTLLVPFMKIEEACDAVAALFNAGVQPSSLEFMERRAIDAVLEFLGETNVPVEDEVEAHLLVSLDENIENELENCLKVLRAFEVGEILFAETESEKERLWKIRRRLSTIVKQNGYTIEEDTVVPRAHLAKLVKSMHQLADERGFKVVCYGHAGDGNLHIRINHPKHKNSYNIPEIQSILKELFKIVRDLGGTISGEHGIGLVQRPYLSIVFCKSNLELQKSIKKAVDPNNIMNPGKLYI